MPLRLVIMVPTALAVAAVDLLVKALVTTPAWDFHQRSAAWSALLAVLLASLVALTVLPSRLVAVGSGVVAGGLVGNLVSAAAHGGRVPNPLVWGDVAFNLADVFALVGVPVLIVALLRVTVRNRERIDRLIPPRRWELALRRRLGL